MFDVLDGLRDAVDKVLASDAPVDPVAVRRQIERLECAFLRGVGEVDRSEQWRAEGFVSPSAWLRQCGRVTHATASAAVVVARRLARLPEAAAALAAGEVSRKHVDAIAEAFTPEREAAISDVEAQLVDAARQFDPRELRMIVRRVTDALDGDGGAAADEAQHARRRLHVSPVLDGMGVIDGLLDGEATEVVITALDAAMERDRSPDDQRSRPQRRADALVALCRRALDRGTVGGSRRVRPHVSVVVDLAEIERRGGTELVAQVRADAAHVGRLSVATLERLTCDCDISRVVTAGRSDVLDTGRAARTVPPALWRALVVRDRHCRAPGCDRPPGWCEAHHVVHWSKGGPTTLGNLVLLCWRHHRARHAADARPRAP